MARKPPRSPEQRLARWSRSMSPGTLNGKVASASPLAVDLTKLGPRQRALPPSSSFDPNENPVVIGANSLIDNTGTDAPATPSSINGIFEYGVVIGGSAVLHTNDNEPSTVIGGSATGNSASTSHGVTVVGYSATAYDSGVAVGESAFADEDCVAIGYHVDTSSLDVAIGKQAFCAGNATAIGAFSSALQNGCAVGSGAVAAGQPSNGGVAVGKGARASGPEGTVAIGYLANVAASEDRTIAIGANSTATGSDNVVVGDHAADAGFTNVVVLGSASAATVDNQTVLGNLTTATFAETNQGYVVVDSVTAARQMITVANGVVTVVAAP